MMNGQGNGYEQRANINTMKNQMFQPNQQVPQSQQMMLKSMPENNFLKQAFSNAPQQQQVVMSPNQANTFQRTQQQQVLSQQNFNQQQQIANQQMLQNRQLQNQQMNPMSPQSNGVYSPSIKMNNSMRSSMQGNSLPPLQHQNSCNSSNENFKVVIRIRPPLNRERIPGCEFQSVTQVAPDNKQCSIMEYLGAEVDEQEKQKDIEANPHLCVWQSFNFDYVYDDTSTQEFVYENTAKQAVSSVLEGYNATVLAYGQTGTGKTYTMEGFKYSAGDPQRGIVPRSMEEIFRFIQMQSSQNTTFMVRASYLQIYNEVISDLLKIDRTSLQVREDKKKGVFVEGLSEWAVRSPNEIYSLMQKGALSRATATTKMNDLSSRSHAVFIIIVEQMTLLDDEEQDANYDDDCAKAIKVGKLNLVDLAGSERVRVTGATGKRLEESKKINQSLSCLGNVIAALTDQKSRSHIPYRDSKLTRLLEDSLGGNCKTTMMAMISPSADGFCESLSTLKFATRAKKIKNEAKINEDIDQRALLRKYEVELRKLKSELSQRTNQISQSKEMLQLEADKKRAEEDKVAAINELNSRQQEIEKEKEEKKKLEEKIHSMHSQLLVGGKKVEDTPQFRNALEEKQRLIRQEYECKFQEIEKERGQIEEDKAQVDRYKQLLLKQRDIMIALTSRLNERDETIIQLQEELDAYDRIHREAEYVIDIKTQRNNELEYFIREQCGQEPPQSQFSEDEIQQNPMKQISGLAPQERRYQPHNSEYVNSNEEMPLQLLTADEKISELQQILEHQEFQLSQEHNQFPNGNFEEIVNQEVQKRMNQLNSTQNSTNQIKRDVQQMNEEKNHYMQQIQKLQQEKEAFLMISNDIQGLVNASLQDISHNQSELKNQQALQKLNEATKLVNSLQKHLRNEKHRSSIDSENMPPKQRSLSKSSYSNQASPQHQNLPQQNNHQIPFNPNGHNQQPGISQTPRNRQINLVQPQGHLPPKHQQTNSGGNMQQMTQQNQHENNVKGNNNIPPSVTEMLRRRQEQKKFTQ